MGRVELISEVFKLKYICTQLLTAKSASVHLSRLTTDVASAVATLYLHTIATVHSFKRAFVTKTEFLDIVSCGADHYQKVGPK